MAVTDKIVSILRDRAEVREIANRRCFVVPSDVFYGILDLLDGTPLRTDDRLTRTHDLENIEYRASSKDEYSYLICTKAEPMLDSLWESKAILRYVGQPIFDKLWDRKTNN